MTLDISIEEKATSDLKSTNYSISDGVDFSGLVLLKERCLDGTVNIRRHIYVLLSPLVYNAQGSASLKYHL